MLTASTNSPGFRGDLGSVPVEVSFDPLLDQPQGMMGLVVEVAADISQDLWGHVGEVIPGVGETQNLYKVLTNHRLRGGVSCAEAAAEYCAPIGRRREE